MEVVGSFLNQLFRLHGNSSSIPQRSVRIHSSPVHYQQDKLYSVPGFTQEDLILLILNIYRQPPATYTVFHCHSSTTEQDLKRFTERIIQHQNCHYTMLEINKLPHHLQEVWTFKVLVCMH